MSKDIKKLDCGCRNKCKGHQVLETEDSKITGSCWACKARLYNDETECQGCGTYNQSKDRQTHE